MIKSNLPQQSNQSQHPNPLHHSDQSQQPKLTQQLNSDRPKLPQSKQLKPSRPKVRALSRWQFLFLLVGTLLILLTLFLIFHSQPSTQPSPNDHAMLAEENPDNTQKDPSAPTQTNPGGNSQAHQDPGTSSPHPSSQGQPAISGNCTENFGILMLINPNFTVSQEFIASRQTQLISISQAYGIPEYHRAGNGDNLLLPEAAAHLDDMINAYKAAYPGHEMGTYSCFRARGTSCGRLCAATGASDHHTGLTCDLIDLQYGAILNTDDYPNHLEWQWLRENSYKYGFIDRFPESWAGGPMSEPLNVDANGTTGLYETWHYRYVGVDAATDIAAGKHNNGAYDSLEHYLKSTNRVHDLKAGLCR